MDPNTPVSASALIVDTGPVVALMNTSDQHHEACLSLLASARGPLLIPEPLITEITYMVGTRGGSEAGARFLEDTVDGPYEILSLSAEDRHRTAELVRAYRIFRSGPLMRVLSRSPSGAVCKPSPLWISGTSRSSARSTSRC